MKAMIFAAGYGTRLKPITNYIPKALVPINDIALLEHVIERLKLFGYNDIVINIHHLGQQIIDFVEAKNNFGIKIAFSDERKKLLDTGGAVKKAQPFLRQDENILIHNADILSNINLQNASKAHAENNALATLIVSKRKTSRYLLFNSNNQLYGWINKDTGVIKSPYQQLNHSAFRKLAFSGIHILSRKAFKLMEDFPEKFSIIDFYLSICDKHKVAAYETTSNSMIDVGKTDSLQEASLFLQKQNIK